MFLVLAILAGAMPSHNPNLALWNSYYFKPVSYPPLAHQAQIQGVAVADAILNEEGKVVRVETVSGHPMLLQVFREYMVSLHFSCGTCKSPAERRYRATYDFQIDKCLRRERWLLRGIDGISRWPLDSEGLTA